MCLHVCSVAQSCLTLCNAVDCSPPGSSVHGILQARILEWLAIPCYRGIVPNQGSNPGLAHREKILYHLSHKGSPRRLEWAVTEGPSWPRNWTGVSCIAGRFFTNWATSRRLEWKGLSQREREIYTYTYIYTHCGSTELNITKCNSEVDDSFKASFQTPPCCVNMSS